mmetsp:Transcript_28052/g.90436  ORF Transcript_28052/g.90436 Transcript_28052/m.90436 type:complete len:269 (+) Transcript_28052:395-1201(+)
MPMASSPYSLAVSSSWKKARLFTRLRMSVTFVFSLAFRTRFPPRFFFPTFASGAGRALTFWALGGSQSFSIFDLMSSTKPDATSSADAFLSSSFEEKASTRAARETLAATILRTFLRKGAGAAWTRSAKYKIPVWGIWATRPKPARSLLLSWPRATRLHAGTLANFSRPPAMPTSIAARDAPTSLEMFGARLVICASKKSKIWNLSFSNENISRHARRHARNCPSVKAFPVVVDPVTLTTMTCVGGRTSFKSTCVMSISFFISSTTRA